MATKPVNPFAKAGATTAAPSSPVRPMAVEGGVSIAPSVLPSATARGKPVNPFAPKNTVLPPAPVSDILSPTVSVPQTPPQRKADPSPFSPSATIPHGAATVDALLPSPMATAPVSDDDMYDLHRPLSVAPVTPAVAQAQSAATKQPVLNAQPPVDALAALNPFQRQVQVVETIAGNIRGTETTVTLAQAAAATTNKRSSMPVVPPPLPPVPPPEDETLAFVPSIAAEAFDSFTPSVASTAFIDDTALPSAAPPLPLSSPPPLPDSMLELDQFGVPLPLPGQGFATEYYDDPLEAFLQPAPSGNPFGTGHSAVDDDDLFGGGGENGGGSASLPTYAAPPPVRREGGESRPGPKSILDATNSSKVYGGSSTSAAATATQGQGRGGGRNPGSAGGRGGPTAARAGARSAASSGTGRGAGRATGATTGRADVAERLKEHYGVSEAQLRAEGGAGDDEDEYELDLDGNDRPKNIRTGRGGVASASRVRDSQGSRGESEADMNEAADGELAMEGAILARSDAYSLFSKEWKPHYWVIKGSYLLLYSNV